MEYTEDQKRAIVDFCNRICQLAEAKIAQTYRVEGAHYASMVELLAQLTGVVTAVPQRDRPLLDAWANAYREGKKRDG